MDESPPRGKAGRPKGSKSRPKPPQVLVDMRVVYESDGKEGKEVLKTLYADNPRAFVADMRSEERSWRAAGAGKAEAAAGDEAAGDVGATAALSLVDELLGKYGEKCS